MLEARPASFLFHCFEVDRHRYFVAHYGAAGLYHLIPGKAEGFAADGGGRGRAGASVAPRILDRSRRPVDRERDFLRDAMQREVADDVPLPGPGRLNLLRLECHGRIFRDVEEVGALEVGVAVRGTR